MSRKWAKFLHSLLKDQSVGSSTKAYIVLCGLWYNYSSTGSLTHPGRIYMLSFPVRVHREVLVCLFLSHKSFLGYWWSATWQKPTVLLLEEASETWECPFRHQVSKIVRKYSVLWQVLLLIKKKQLPLWFEAP